MELRWYWRVVRRQWRVVWITTLVVALLAAAYTAFTFSGSRYKGQTTVEFSQRQPTYHTQNISIDPLQAAEGNAGSATGSAKQFTQGIVYFQEISDYLKQHNGLNIDWKVIRSGLGANPSNGRYLGLEYSTSNADRANTILSAATVILGRDFLPQYNSRLLAVGTAGNVEEPPIVMTVTDPPNAPSTSLSTTVISWLLKALVGVVLGLALAFLWEYLDESIHDEQDVLNWMHAPTLGVIAGGK